MVIFGHINWSSFGNYQMWMYWLGQLSLGQFFTPDSLREFGVGSPNGSLWTIPIEIEFYVIIPLLFILFTKIKVQTKLIIFACISILINIVYALYSPSEHNTNATELLTNSQNTLIFKLIGVTVAPYLYCFLLGSLIYVYWEKVKTLFVNKALYWLVVFLVFVYVSRTGATYQITNIGSLISNILLGCLSISAAFSFGRINRFLFGIDISYGIYIIHMIIVNIYLELGYGNTLMDACSAILITILLSLIMYKFVEKPALALKYNFHKQTI